jgi:hypothetical protein
MVLKVAGVVVLWTVLSLAGMFALVFAGLHLTSQGTAGALLVPWLAPLAIACGVASFWLVFRRRAAVP